MAGASGVVTLTAEAFDDSVLGAEGPVVVDFWATWCRPCRALDPLMEAFARHFADRLRVMRLDVDAAPQLAERYDVRAIPTLLFFEDGRVTRRLTGAEIRSALAPRSLHGSGTGSS